jgi:hypothetical protein
MYTFTFHGFEFDLDTCDWAPGKFVEESKNEAIELFSEKMEQLLPEVIKQAHADMLADQADGLNQCDVLNGHLPMSAAYQTVIDCQNGAASAVFGKWNKWPASGHNFSVTAK